MKLTEIDPFKLEGPDLRSGLPAPERPEDDHGELLQPKMPVDLSKASNDRLGRLMGQLVSCANYCSYIAAIDDVQFVMAENRLEYLTAMVRMQKSGNVTVRRDKARIDPRVREANREYLTAMAKMKITAVLLQNYERQISVVSREITRRGFEVNRTLSNISS